VSEEGITHGEGLPGRCKPYPEYKHSGIEWLGEIPAHWDVMRVKRLFHVVNGSTPVSSVPEYWDGDIVWVTPDDLGRLTSDTIVQGSRNISKVGHASCATPLVPPGSLVLSTRAPIGHLALAGVELCTNQGCKCLLPRQAQHVGYFYHQLAAARPELESLGEGSTFQELSGSRLEAVLLGRPPVGEQSAIADFLDRETAKIDALMAKKERLIELLQEKRTALISQAVTKGLDRNVPMKDSGIDWLGEIPVHWDTTRVKFLAWFNYGDSLGADSREEGEVPVYGSNGPVGTHARANTLAPCMVIGRKGSFGKINYCNTPCFAIDTTFFIDPSTSTAEMRWLYYALSLLGLDSLSQDAAVPGLSRQYAHDQWVPHISPEEQHAIAALLDRQTAKIDGLIAGVGEAIEKLKEYRTALISAAVTGKIDVREAAS